MRCFGECDVSGDRIVDGYALNLNEVSDTHKSLDPLSYYEYRPDMGPIEVENNKGVKFDD